MVWLSFWVCCSGGLLAFSSIGGSNNMWNIASTTSSMSAVFSNTGIILAVVFGSVLVGLIALFGLGYGIRGVGALLSDRSIHIGDFYLRDLPYKGYNRWRSRKWNMEHTMQ